MRVLDLLLNESPTRTFSEKGVRNKVWVAGSFHFVLCTEDRDCPHLYWAQIRYDVESSFGLPSHGSTMLLASVGADPEGGLTQLVEVVEKLFWLLLSKQIFDLGPLELPSELRRTAWERL